MAAIETHSLTKKYGDVFAVHDVDLRVERGEVFGFLGPNGAGKSTTINMLLDFVRPTSGDVSIFGRNPQEETRAVRERIGVLPEANGYYEKATAREHVEFAIDMKCATNDPESILQRVGIADEANRAVGGFSKGMRQRLGLGIALVASPDILILDEPLSGLDPTGAHLLRNIICTERNRGAAVFFSSHIMDQVEMLCDRVGIMNDGKLIAVDDVESLREKLNTPSVFIVSVDSVPEDHGLDSLDDVADVSTQKNALRITCTQTTTKVNIVRHLESMDTVITDINSEPIPLERLFLEFTGPEANV